jgi:hypothetical protein
MLDAPGGAYAAGVEEILGAVRDSMERSAIPACRDFLSGLAGFLQGHLLGEGNHREKQGVQPLAARQVELGQLQRGNLLLPHHPGKLAQGGESQIFIGHDRLPFQALD